MASGAVADNRVFKCSVQMTVLQQQIQTGFHLRDVGLDNMDAGEVVTALEAWLNDEFKTIQPPALRFDRVEATELTSKQYAMKEFSGLVGTGNFTVGTTFTSLLVSLRTASRQRHMNGRMYWPWIMAGGVESGVLGSGVQAVATAAVDDFANRFTGSALTHDLRCVVVSTPRPLTANRPAILHEWHDVETVKINPVISVQRRRKIGVGS